MFRELLKCLISGKTVSNASYIKKKNTKTEKDLELKLAKLRENYDTDPSELINTEISILEDELIQHREKKSNRLLPLISKYWLGIPNTISGYTPFILNKNDIKMTSRVKETLHATFVLFIIPMIFTDGVYVQYTINGDRRLCLPYLNCEPGHEIQPCAVDYTEDICTLCTNGLVQPDLISSSPNGNQNETKCFAPIKKCDANEIKYSRSEQTAFCDALVGCECDTTKCYYGDPCLCDDKQTECEIGEYLNKTGGCENCTEGTEKAEKGCGPCRRTTYISNRESNGVPEVKISTKRTETQSAKLSLSLSTSSQSPIVHHLRKHIDESDNTTMIIIVAVLSVAVVTLFIVVVCIWRTREQVMCRFNICLNHSHRDPIVPLQEQIPLNQAENGDAQEVVDNKTTEGGKPTATPTDNGNAEIYRDQSTSNQCKFEKENLNTSANDKCHTNNSVSRSSNLPYVDSWSCKYTTMHNECNIDQVSFMTEDMSSAIETYPFKLKHHSSSSLDDRDSQRGEKVLLVRDKLYIDGDLFKPHTEGAGNEKLHDAFALSIIQRRNIPLQNERSTNQSESSELKCFSRGQTNFSSGYYSYNDHTGLKLHN
ncbi:unnamed protein product [Mytilus coruscus]|uniref:Uncharacterized protein n=1 Tax=Mytilus coruscus TaxID=42192 RepID=A0A6J8DBS2_MYTCO|nr:unnamed protein product [Mytilus coruscus]